MSLHHLYVVPDETERFFLIHYSLKTSQDIVSSSPLVFRNGDWASFY